MGKKQSNSHSQDSLDNREKIGKNNPPKSTRFSSTNQPLNSGRPKGSRSRSTIVREWLEANYKKVNPITGQTETLQIQDHLVISLIGKALKGDVPAFKELMDSGHGKIIDGLDVTSKGESITSGEKLSPEDRRMLIDKLRSEMGSNNG
jgi:hypothetical protein